mgnify:CR=1 FL=1|tara:strand:+ start:1041 stop:1226 length:186 start_codon:yes stop_codon:yes gene_type:complete
MRNEKEIRELYSKMVENTTKLVGIISNPPDDMNFEEIKEVNEQANSQHSMNALIKWVLNEN